MSASEVSVPEQLPVLSRGKHRRPRKGACLMELVSYLAGERWSDHPACTHPLLAAVARQVNDFTSDDARPRLAVVSPSLIGLVSDDLHVDVRIGLRCATSALPVVAEECQQVMAVAVLTCERLLDELDSRPAGTLEESSRAALERAPHAVTWAHRFTRRHRPSPAAFRRHAAPSIVSSAVRGIAQACVDDPDRLLYELLVDVIDDCRVLVRGSEDFPTVECPRWAQALDLTGCAPSR